MKRIFPLTLIIIAPALVFDSACSLVGEKNEKHTSFENTVYATVFFEETLEGGAPRQGLIAINSDNPSEHYLISSDTVAYKNIRVSPDGTKIIYEDDYSTGGTPIFGIYNIEEQRSGPLINHNRDLVFGPSWLGVVWDANSTGFYTTNPKYPFTSYQHVAYYNLTDSTLNIIHNGEGNLIYPVGLKGIDTLIVFSNEFTAPSYRFYMMNLEGEYLEEINNPYLQHDEEEETLITDLAWNNTEQLFAASYSNKEEFVGYKIVVTDLSGEIFKEFTDGTYLNTNPRWTRNGKIIYTEQRDLYNNRKNSELKLLDPNSSDITSFFSKNQFSTITGVGNADY